LRSQNLLCPQRFLKDLGHLVAGRRPIAFVRVFAQASIVPVDIAIQPSSTFFAAGEQLHLIISSEVVVPSNPFVKCSDCNGGVHVIHVGAEYDSHLLLPIVEG
jgi:predicted acyl esterase